MTKQNQKLRKNKAEIGVFIFVVCFLLFAFVFTGCIPKGWRDGVPPQPMPSGWATNHSSDALPPLPQTTAESYSEPTQSRAVTFAAVVPPAPQAVVVLENNGATNYLYEVQRSFSLQPSAFSLLTTVRGGQLLTNQPAGDMAFYRLREIKKDTHFEWAPRPAGGTAITAYELQTTNGTPLYNFPVTANMQDVVKLFPIGTNAVQLVAIAGALRSEPSNSVKWTNQPSQQPVTLTMRTIP